MRRAGLFLRAYVPVGFVGVMLLWTCGPGKAAAQEVIVPDFQVNENEGSADQYAVVVARQGSGEFVMVWLDQRNGDPDVYGQRFSGDGSPLGDNFRVNDDTEAVYQSWPSVGIDGTGNFVVAWSDEREGEEHDVYVQRFSSNGTPLGVNLKVNDDNIDESHIRARVAAGASGAFVVAWEDRRNGGVDIYAQRFSGNGTPEGSNFLVNDDLTNAHQSNPSVAVDGAGNFAVVWTDVRDGGLDIYAQGYADDGTSVGTNFKVNDDAGTARQFNPTVAFDGIGDFAVTWMDERESPPQIYAQRYAANGTTQGVNFKVTEDIGTTSPNYPSVSKDGAGKFVIAWQAFLNSDLNIYAQRFAAAGTALGSNFLVNDDPGEGWQQAPSASMDEDGNFVLAWGDSRNLNDDIFAQLYTSGGGAQGGNFVVNQDSGSAHQNVPVIATDGNRNFIIAWEDERNGFADIYAQRLANDGSYFGPNFIVNDDGLAAHHVNPSISADLSGSFVIVWRDGRNNGEADIYAQRYDGDGSPLGSNWRVNDDPGGTTQYYPSIAVGGSGRFVIVWEDDRDGDDDIYAQRYAADGSPLGGNFKVNDDGGSEDQNRPSVDTGGDGGFVIAWEDRRNGDGDIFLQRFASDGTALGINAKANDDPGDDSQYSAAVSMDGDGNFVAAWEDYRVDDDGDIYAQRYRANGIPQGGNIKVTDEEAGPYPGSASVSANDGGDFLIVWYEDRIGGDDVYGQRYHSDGALLGGNFRVTGTDAKLQRYPDVKLRDDRIYTTWMDSRAGGTGFDIWANVLTWDDPIGTGDDMTMPRSFRQVLGQNFPNPSKVATMIGFDLAGTPDDLQPVSLTIFDIQGRLVRRLVDAELEGGRHTIYWNGRNDRGEPVASGLYLYTLRVEDGIYTRRMTVIE